MWKNMLLSSIVSVFINNELLDPLRISAASKKNCYQGDGYQGDGYQGDDYHGDGYHKVMM